MIDIHKLNKMLDDALAAESVESLNLWMEQQIEADREAGIIRDADFGILNSRNFDGLLSTQQEYVIEIGKTEYIAYNSADISGVFDIDCNNSYKYAA